MAMDLDFELMEGTRRRLRVAFVSGSGEPLPVESYLVYGAALPRCGEPVPFEAVREADAWVLTVPALPASRLGVYYQVHAAAYATGVEWLLLCGEIDVQERLAGADGGMHPQELSVSCALDSVTMQMEVSVGESTASCAQAVEYARESAEAAAECAGRAAKEAEEAERYAAAAAKSADDAEDLAQRADDYMADAEAAAKSAEAAAAEAEASMSAAKVAADAVEASAAEVAARAGDAAASAKAAADSASDAIEAEAAALASEAAAARSAEEARGCDMRAFEYGNAAEAAADAAAAAAESAAAAQAEAEAQALAAATSAATLFNPFAECTTWADVLRICPTINQCGHMSLVLPNMKGRVDGLLTNYELELDLTFPHKTYFVTTALLNIKAKHVKLYLPNMTGGNQSIMKHHNITHSASLIAPKMTDVGGTFRYDQTHGAVQMGHALSIYAPNATNASRAFWGQHRIGKITLYAPKCTSINYLFSPMMNNQYADAPRMSLTLGDVTQAEYAFEYCKRVPDRDFPAAWRFLKYGNMMFASCELGRDLAISVLNSLQTATEETGTNIWCITVGIHVDHKTDEEVLAAIEAAEARGWTVAVQWNGTATAAAASTYGMRRAGIYARRCEAEEEGEQSSLEWAHYVTNWEAHGYLEFSSVEEAAEFFGVELEPAAPEEE